MFVAIIFLATKVQTILGLRLAILGLILALFYSQLARTDVCGYYFFSNKGADHPRFEAGDLLGLILALFYSQLACTDVCGYYFFSSKGVGYSGSGSGSGFSGSSAVDEPSSDLISESGLSTSSSSSSSF